MKGASLPLIIEAASELFDIGPRDIRSHYKPMHLREVRQAISVVARDHGHSFEAIGDAVERRHSSVVRWDARARRRIVSDESFAAGVDRLRGAVAS